MDDSCSNCDIKSCWCTALDLDSVNELIIRFVSLIEVVMLPKSLATSKNLILACRCNLE